MRCQSSGFATSGLVASKNAGGMTATRRKVWHYPRLMPLHKRCSLSRSPEIIRSGPRLVNAQLTATDFISVQGLNGFVAIIRAGHLDETEAFRTLCLPVEDYFCGLDRAEFLEHRLEV